MGVEETFGSLRVGLARLYDGVNALSVTIGDRPPSGQVLVVDQLEGETAELLGLLNEARSAAEEAVKGLRAAAGLDGARRALVLCQRRMQTIDRMYAEMVSFDRVKELLGVGERGKEWALWAKVIKQALEESGVPMREVREAIDACWQELTELVLLTRGRISSP
jgi:hypothetical protein